MMLYNEFRPSSFDELIGQDHISSVIKKAIEINKIPHAMILSGKHGTGKTSVARILAKELKIDRFDIIEIDAAAHNKVEDVNHLIKTTRVRPSIASKYKIYIIDEAHSYTNQAQTSLLKILEEPPKYCIFILATTDPLKLIATIRSRAMPLILKDISVLNIAKQLRYICTEKSIPHTEDALFVIANKAEGSMRDALSDLQLCIGGCTMESVEDKLGVIGYLKMIELLEALRDANLDKLILALNKLHTKYDAKTLVLEIGTFVRNLFYFKSKDTAQLITVSTAQFTAMQKLLKELTIPFAYALLDVIQLNNISLETTNRAVYLLLEIELYKLVRKRKAWLKNR